MRHRCRSNMGFACARNATDISVPLRSRAACLTAVACRNPAAAPPIPHIGMWRFPISRCLQGQLSAVGPRSDCCLAHQRGSPAMSLSRNADAEPMHIENSEETQANLEEAADEGRALQRRYNAMSRNVHLNRFQLNAGSYKAAPKRRNAVARSLVAPVD